MAENKKALEGVETTKYKIPPEKVMIVYDVEQIKDESQRVQSINVRLIDSYIKD